MLRDSPLSPYLSRLAAAGGRIPTLPQHCIPNRNAQQHEVSVSEVEKLAAYLREVKRVTGSWPKTLIVHPSADLAVVIAAIRLARAQVP